LRSRSIRIPGDSPWVVSPPDFHQRFLWVILRRKSIALAPGEE
jgi:hypothetical protein